MKKNEELRTAGFVGFGVLMCVAAGLTYFLTQPSKSKDFELVGQPFFEEFTSANQARSLEVAALNPDSATLQKFSVAEKDGLWVIPSHYNYPAEAAQRLATTATSVMGIERESLVGRLESEHERFGVLDPLDDAARDPDATGKRITLKNDSDEAIVDFIIGKEAGDVEIPMADRAIQDGPTEKYYYVRRPDEMQTYKVRLNVDLSTRFADWIEPDLLKLAKPDIRKIVIDNYELQEQGGLGQRQVLKIQGDQLDFSRAGGIDDWNLEGMNEATEELEKIRIDEIMDALDQMKIVGVRPKFKYMDQQLVTAELTINENPEFQKNPREFSVAMNRLLTELTSRGFTIYEDPDPTLISTFGSMTVGTEDGVEYILNFGKSVEGDEKAIEIGSVGESKETTKDDKDQEEPASDEDASKDGSEKDSADGQEVDPTAANDLDKATNRYLMIRVVFDESLLGDRPQKPIQPLKPAEPENYEPLPKEEPKDPADETNESSDDKPDAAPTLDENKKRNPEFTVYDEAMVAYVQQMTEYNLNLTRYEDEIKVHEAQVEAGTKRVKELNERFGDWYYVISANNLSSIQTKRTDAVKLKEVPQAESDARGVPLARPDISFEMPEGDFKSPSSDDGKKTTEQPTDDKGSESDEGSKPDDDGLSERPPTQVPSGEKVEQDGEKKGEDSSEKKPNGGSSQTSDSQFGRDWFNSIVRGADPPTSKFA